MSETSNAVVEASATTAAAFGSKATLGGGFASAAAFFMHFNWIGWLSLGIAVLGLLINWYFSWQRNHREKELHKLKVKKLNGECNVE